MCGCVRAIWNPCEWISFYCDCCWDMYVVWACTAPDDLVLLLLFHNSHHCHTDDICWTLRSKQRTHRISLNWKFWPEKREQNVRNCTQYTCIWFGRSFVRFCGFARRQAAIHKSEAAFQFQCTIFNVHRAYENNSNKIFGLNLFRMNCYCKIQSLSNLLIIKFIHLLVYETMSGVHSVAWSLIII